MAEYPKLFMDQIYDNIAGEYCQNYMSEEEFEKKESQDLGALTDWCPWSMSNLSKNQGTFSKLCTFIY